ncbi:MAG TPA: response regulator [Anaerolineae bacterium]|nr:response regulator [Anaerolineae bacterium]HMR63637.1 response regulator [Anaerolineae bacterium]
MSNPSILIVEDDRRQRDIFSLALQPTFEVETCADGLDALSRLNAYIPNLVLLDLHVPSLSGHDLLYQIRADKRLASTRVIIVSADIPAANNIKEQADLVLHKPVSIRQLQDLVHLAAA